MSLPLSALDRIDCARCGKRHDPRGLLGVCSCGGPLLARYAMERAARTLTAEALKERGADMWRYAELLPPCREPVSLGEGMTPLIDLPETASELGLKRIAVKDEGVNPTASFKARGLSCAVTAARERGVKHGAIPSAGNAASALAAYGARAGIAVDIYLPADTPAPFLSEARLHGARLRLVDGTISDCARLLREESQRGNGERFDFSTLREPYRIEGKKTMAFELWEQMKGQLPDVLIYPTGGGTGLIGMWKAFGEMRELGWRFGRAPRMISVQASGCAPIVAAFEKGQTAAEPWRDARTIASGLRVPSALGDFLILRALRESEGAAVAVSDCELLDGARALARLGILAGPEGGACLAALRACLERAIVKANESVVLFNTGSGLKYLDRLEAVAEETA